MPSNEVPDGINAAYDYYSPLILNMQVKQSLWQVTCGSTGYTLNFGQPVPYTVAPGSHAHLDAPPAPLNGEPPAPPAPPAPPQLPPVNVHRRPLALGSSGRPPAADQETPH